jgi:hypothetical protein
MKLKIVRNLVGTTLLAGGAILTAGHLAGTGKAFANPPRAGGCASMLQSLKAWTTINRDHVVDFAMATNRSDRLVSYGQGTLRYQAGMLTGQGTQLFSDRTAPGDQPFDVGNADRFYIWINPSTGAVKFRLYTPTGPQYIASPVQCGYGVLYGFSKPAKVTLVTLSFHKGPA